MSRGANIPLVEIIMHEATLGLVTVCAPQKSISHTTKSTKKEMTFMLLL